MEAIVPKIAPTWSGSTVRRSVPSLVGLAAVAAALTAGYLEFQARLDGAFLIALSTALFVGTGILLIRQGRRGDGILALITSLLLVPQGLTMPAMGGQLNSWVIAEIPDTGWTRPLDLAFVVPAVALVLRAAHGRLGIPGLAVVGILATMLVVTPAVAVAVGSLAPSVAEATAAVLALAGSALLVAVSLQRGDRVSREARVPLAVVAIGMLLAAAVQVYTETLMDGFAPPPWYTILGPLGPWDVRDFSAAMIPLALVADSIRRAEARADVGRRVVASARVGGVEGIRAALRSGLREPDIDLLPPGAGDLETTAPATPTERTRIPLRSHDGIPLAIVDLPRRTVDPLVLNAAVAAARVGLEHVHAVERLRTRIRELEASRSEFVTTVEQERRHLNEQLSSGLREPLRSLESLLREASADLAAGDDDAARTLLVSARARLTVAHRDLRLLARGVYPAVLSQSGLAVALRALTEERLGRLRVVVSPSVETRRRSSVVEAAGYFVVATLPQTGQGVLDVAVAAYPPPDGDGIELVLTGAVPIGVLTAGDEARRVEALGGWIEANSGGQRIVVNIPPEPKMTSVAAVTTRTS